MNLYGVLPDLVPLRVTMDLSNYGSVRNSGVEIELNATPIQTKDFSWDLGLTFAYNKGVVVDLPDNGEEKHR